MFQRNLVLCLVLVAAACGDDSTPAMPDGPPGGACTGTVGEIASYPGTYMGTVVGGGADLTVGMGECTAETGDLWFDPVGEDVIVKLGGLTVGKNYVITLTTMDDLSFYVVGSCPPATGNVTGCLNFTDETFTNEAGVFVATATEHYLVVDASNDPDPPTDGVFTLDVKEAECTEATEATDCGAATPFCVNFACVQCASLFDCSGTTPVCSAEGACAAGPMTCTGDDAGDTSSTGDDGPSVARMLAAPTAGNPVTATGAICNSPAGLESDWYKVTLTGDIGISLDFTGATNDLDVLIVSAAGTVIESGESNAGINEAIRTTNLVPGMYYVIVRQFAPAGTVVAVPYTLKLLIPECTNDFGCLTAASPVCNGAGACGVGPSNCVGDDTSDIGVGADDGPAAARTLTSGVAATGSICSSPGSEADFYKITVANGQGLDLSLAWTNGATPADLDPDILDSTGAVMGRSFYLNPELVKVTYLPAGTYYVKVTSFGGNTPSTAVQAYTLTTTVTAAQVCTTSTQCAAEYSTQLYRGLCDTAGGGVCKPIPAGAGAVNTPCDSGNDCASMRCSYIAFDADAQDSVCSTTCTSTATCTAISAGLTCTTGFQTNFCVPGCTSDLECGANAGSATVTTGQPWDYLTCTVGTMTCGI